MHRYRTHTCGALRDSDIGSDVRLSGWCHRIRDHGGLLFIDLRDHYGLTQVVADPDSARPSRPPRRCARNGWSGSTARCAGARPAPRTRTCRPARSRSSSREIEVLGPAGELPMPVFGDQEYPEEIAAQVPLPRPAPRAAAPQHHEARRDHRFDPPAHEGAGLLRVPDADPDRVVARRARATFWCRRGSIRESSTRCRRRRSSSSSSS